MFQQVQFAIVVTASCAAGEMTTTTPCATKAASVQDGRPSATLRGNDLCVGGEIEVLSHTRRAAACRCLRAPAAVPQVAGPPGARAVTRPAQTPLVSAVGRAVAAQTRRAGAGVRETHEDVLISARRRWTSPATGPPRLAALPLDAEASDEEGAWLPKGTTPGFAPGFAGRRALASALRVCPRAGPWPSPGALLMSTRGGVFSPDVGRAGIARARRACPGDPSASTSDSDAHPADRGWSRFSASHMAVRCP